MEKLIKYDDENIIVNSNGTIIWNNTIRNQYLDKDGYPRISYKCKKGWRSVSVHRLIAIAFVPNPNNLPEIDHINFDRTDYRIENLAWITHKDNVRKSVINKPDMHGKNNPNYGNKKLSQFYKENPDIAKIKQGRPGKQNGRYKHGKYAFEKV